MVSLLSGSIGQKDATKHDKHIGALVYVKSQKKLGYVLRPIDSDVDFNMCRFVIWTSDENFGTFFDDVTIIQILTGSF